ncbi:MAG: hypothetical protein LBD23_01830, partial [Oscillospiraceae bacterium]|nr:hypothetical protein [Oscillospiraceae bacterium]
GTLRISSGGFRKRRNAVYDLKRALTHQSEPPVRFTYTACFATLPIEYFDVMVEIYTCTIVQNVL